MNPRLARGYFTMLGSVNQILDREFVFIKNDEDVVTGIITIYDIALQFKHLSEPFIELQLIEDSIRKFIDQKIDNKPLTLFFNKKYPGKKIETTRDLTFGEYIAILENKDLWSPDNINLDRKTFIEKLDVIRKIRNDLMHFKITQLSDDSMKELKDVSKFFRMLEKVT